MLRSDTGLDADKLHRQGIDADVALGEEEGADVSNGAIGIIGALRIAGVDTGGVGGQVVIAIIRIDEEGIFVDVAFTPGDFIKSISKTIFATINKRIG